ncbi:MAG: hypothetical protein J7496_15115 [Novosphingobium sp.]|nr:hypothetical protein [Novosphingobium sp.]MBO9603831.1 hypothetical protein [Novosphingobium sp.]
MSETGRAGVVALGVALIAGGLLMSVFAQGSGIPLVIVGLLVVASVAFERRYGRQGRQRSVPHGDWQLTGERFIDDESGERVEVWIDPLTGERRYEPIGRHPRIADRATHR